MPHMIAKFLKAASITSINIEVIDGDGTPLEQHWNNKNNRKTFKSHMWDFVILQEKSVWPLEQKKSMFKHIKLWNDEITKGSGKTILYMTWCRQSRPDTQEDISRAYEDIADELNLAVAPVGRVWQSMINKDPAAELYDYDGRHASYFGSLIAAWVIFLSLVPIHELNLNDLKMKINADDAGKIENASREVLTDYKFKY